MRNRIMITSTLHGCEGDRQRLFPEYKFPLSKRSQARRINYTVTRQWWKLAAMRKSIKCKTTLDIA